MWGQLPSTLSFGAEVCQGTRGKPGMAKRMFKLGVVVFVAFLSMDSTMAAVASARSTADDCSTFAVAMKNNVTMPNGKKWSAEMEGCGYTWKQEDQSGFWFAAGNANETKCTSECDSVYKFLLKHAVSIGRADCRSSRMANLAVGRCLTDEKGANCGGNAKIQEMFNEKYNVFSSEFNRMQNLDTGYTKASNLEAAIAAKCAPNKCLDDAQELFMTYDTDTIDAVGSKSAIAAYNELLCRKIKVDGKDRYCFADLGEAMFYMTEGNGLTSDPSPQAKEYIDKTYCSTTNLCPKISLKLLGDLFALPGFGDNSELGEVFELATESACQVSDTADKKLCNGFWKAADKTMSKCPSLTSTECSAEYKALHKDWGCCVDTSVTTLEKMKSVEARLDAKNTPQSAYANGCKDIGFGTDTGNNSKGCEWYDQNPPGMCGLFDDDDHTAVVMCCACGGGIQTDGASTDDKFVGVCSAPTSGAATAYKSSAEDYAAINCSTITTSYVKCETPPVCSAGHYGAAPSLKCSAHNQVADLAGCSKCKRQTGCTAGDATAVPDCLAAPLNTNLQKCTTSAEDGYHVIAETGEVKANLCAKLTPTEWTAKLAETACDAGCASIDHSACTGDTHNTSCLKTVPKAGFHKCGMLCPTGGAVAGVGTGFTCTPVACDNQANCATPATTCSTALPTKYGCTAGAEGYYLKGDVVKACTSQLGCQSNRDAAACSATHEKKRQCEAASDGYHLIEGGDVRENVCEIPQSDQWKDTSCAGGKTGEACFWALNKCTLEDPDATTKTGLGTQTPDAGYFDCGIECMPNAVDSPQTTLCKADGSGDCLFSISAHACEPDDNCETSGPGCALGLCAREGHWDPSDCTEAVQVIPKLACTQPKAGFFLSGKKGKPQDKVKACTQQPGCETDTDTVCLNAGEGDVSRYACTGTARPGYHLAGKVAVECTKQENCATSVAPGDSAHANDKSPCLAAGETTKQQCLSPKAGYYVDTADNVAKACFDVSSGAGVVSCKTCSDASLAMCSIAICAEGKHHFETATSPGTCSKTCEAAPDCKTPGTKCQCAKVDTNDVAVTDGLGDGCSNDRTGHVLRYLECNEPNTGFYLDDTKTATACTAQTHCADTTPSTTCSTTKDYLGTDYTSKLACALGATGYTIGGSGNDVAIDADGCAQDGQGGCNGDVKATCSAGDGVNTRSCTCETGYDGTRTDLADTDTFAGCTVNECTTNVPQAPDGGTVEFSDNNNHGSVATFACDTATPVQGGSTTVECVAETANAAWPAPASAATCTTNAVASKTKLVQKIVNAPEGAISMLEIPHREAFKSLGKWAMRHRTAAPLWMKPGATAIRMGHNALTPNAFVEQGNGAAFSADSIRVAWAQAIGKPLTACTTGTDDPLRVELRFADMSQETCGLIKNEMKNDIASSAAATALRVSALSCTAKSTAGLSLLQTAVEGDNSTTSSGSIITATVENPNQPMAAAAKAALYSFSALTSRVVAARKGKRVGAATVTVTGGDPKAVVEEEPAKDDKKCKDGEFDVGGNCMSWWMLGLSVFGILLLGGGSTTAVQGQQKGESKEEDMEEQMDIPVKPTKPLHQKAVVEAMAPKTTSQKKKKAKELDFMEE